jgi:hypothetical protein
MRPLLALVLLGSLAVAAPVPKALKKQDTATLLVGTWKPDNGKGSEWFQFDGEGGMKAWTSGSVNSPALYTYTLDPDPDAREWRMTWSSKGQPKPSYQVVYVIDGDRMYLTYTGVNSTPPTKPDPTTVPNFTRQTPDK